MRIEILGCSGGIGDDRHASSFLIDKDILLDAGSGVQTASVSTHHSGYIFKTPACDTPAANADG